MLADSTRARADESVYVPSLSHAPLTPRVPTHHHRQVYAQNMDDLGAKMNVVLEFVEGMKAQIAAIDDKLDSLTSAVTAMHKVIGWEGYSHGS